HAQEFLVDEVVVGAAERNGEVGLAHPADGEAAGRVEDGRLQSALVHDPEPALRVVDAAAELAAERAVPPVLRGVRPAAGPGTALPMPALENRAKLLGRLGDVTVGVND